MADKTHPQGFWFEVYFAIYASFGSLTEWLTLSYNNAKCGLT